MGWIVTKDHLEDKTVEVIGPRTIKPETVEKLKKGEGTPFRMYDDDGELYYSGRLIGGCEFDPLDHYGTPNAGCTSIKIFSEGKWVTV